MSTTASTPLTTSATKPSVTKITANTANEAKTRLTGRGASVAAVVLAVLWTLPTFGLLISSVRPERAAKTTGWWTFFQNPVVTLDNYRTVLATTGTAGLGKYVVNSFVIVVPAVVIPICLALLASYALAWIDFRGRSLLFVAIFALQIVPIQVTLLPLLTLYNQAGLPVALDLRITARDLLDAQLHARDPARADRGGPGRRGRSRQDLHLRAAPAAQASYRGVRHLPVPVGLERPAGGADLRGWWVRRGTDHGGCPEPQRHP